MSNAILNFFYFLNIKKTKIRFSKIIVKHIFKVYFHNDFKNTFKICV